jgi:hypothetical protein
MPSTRNINPDSPTKVATTISIIERQGERNVPKRYLKDAEWYKDRYLGPGYHIADPDKDDTFCAVDFNFDILQWGPTTPIEDKFCIERPAPIRYSLHIFDEERQDRSRWGPIDGTKDTGEAPLVSFKFGSDNGDTPDPDPDVPIPINKTEE